MFNATPARCIIIPLMWRSVVKSFTRPTSAIPRPNQAIDNPQHIIKSTLITVATERRSFHSNLQRSSILKNFFICWFLFLGWRVFKSTAGASLCNRLYSPAASPLFMVLLQHLCWKLSRGFRHILEKFLAPRGRDRQPHFSRLAMLFSLQKVAAWNFIWQAMPLTSISPPLVKGTLSFSQT